MKSGRLKSGFILSYTAIFIQSIVSIVYTPVMLRILGQNDYGLLQLAISAISNLGILSFGFSGSYMRFYSEYKARGDKAAVASLNGMFLMIFTAASAIALLAGFIIASNAEAIFFRTITGAQADTLKLLLIIMTVNLALSFPCSVFDSYIISQERFSFQKSLIIIASLLNPMMTLPLMLAGYGSLGVAVCIAAITLIKLITSGVYCIGHLGMTFCLRPDGALMKRLSVFSFFIFLNIVSDQINWSVDKLLLGMFTGAESVTHYSLGTQVGSYFLTFSYALLSLLTPRAHTLVAKGANNKELSEFFAMFGHVQFMIMTFIFMMIVSVGKPFMRIWSGLDTNIPYFTAVILTAPLLFTSIQSIGIEIQRAKDMHRFRSVLYILIAAFNLSISIPLCRLFGALGCAAGTCVCLITGNIFIMNIYYKKHVGLDIAMFWKNIARLLPPLAVPVIVSALICIFADTSIVSVAFCAALLTAVYWLSMWFFGLNNREKEFIKSNIR